MVYFDGEWQERAFAIPDELTEGYFGDRILASPAACVREARECDPRERCAVNARVVFVFWPERPVAVFDLLDGFCCVFHKLREAHGVVEVDECECFIGKNERGAAIDNLMDQHLALSQSIAKRLDLVCNTQREVMVSQPHTRARAFLQFSEQARDVELRADVEVRLVERKVKLEDGASRPGFQIYVMRHAQGLYLMCQLYVRERPACEISKCPGRK